MTKHQEDNNSLFSFRMAKTVDFASKPKAAAFLAFRSTQVRTFSMVKPPWPTMHTVASWVQCYTHHMAVLIGNIGGNM